MESFIGDKDVSILIRILVAVVLSGILGWEREAAGKAAGLRTHILVGVAGVLFTVIGEFMAISFRSATTCGSMPRTCSEPSSPGSASSAPG